MKTYHNIGLRKVSIARKLARPAGDIAGCVRYANVAAILRAEVHHFVRELEHEVFQCRTLRDFLAIHVCPRVVNVRFCELPQIGQVKANLFFVHDQPILSVQIPMKRRPINSIDHINSEYRTL